MIVIKQTVGTRLFSGQPGQATWMHPIRHYLEQTWQFSTSATDVCTPQDEQSKQRTQHSNLQLINKYVDIVIQTDTQEKEKLNENKQ